VAIFEKRILQTHRTSFDGSEGEKMRLPTFAAHIFTRFVPPCELFAADFPAATATVKSIPRTRPGFFVANTCEIF
jgi:hypothetical protein